MLKKPIKRFFSDYFLWTKLFPSKFVNLKHWWAVCRLKLNVIQFIFMQFLPIPWKFTGIHVLALVVTPMSSTRIQSCWCVFCETCWLSFINSPYLNDRKPVWPNYVDSHRKINTTAALLSAERHLTIGIEHMHAYFVNAICNICKNVRLNYSVDMWLRNLFIYKKQTILQFLNKRAQKALDRSIAKYIKRLQWSPFSPEIQIEN